MPRGIDALPHGVGLGESRLLLLCTIVPDRTCIAVPFALPRPGAQVQVQGYLRNLMPIEHEAVSDHSGARGGTMRAMLANAYDNLSIPRHEGFDCQLRLGDPNLELAGVDEAFEDVLVLSDVELVLCFQTQEGLEVHVGPDLQ